jgi:hypothetical protein
LFALSLVPAGPVFVITTEFVFAAGAAEFTSPGFAPGALVFASVLAGVGVAVVSVPVDCKIEVLPLSAGMASIKAVSMKVTAAPIVILERIEAVPRGPKAVLETLLVNSAPASDLPGCSNTEAINTTQDKKNMMNKVVCIKT